MVPQRIMWPSIARVLTDDWTSGAASRHIIAPISHTKPSPRSCSYYSFLVPLKVGGWVGQVPDRPPRGIQENCKYISPGCDVASTRTLAVCGLRLMRSLLVGRVVSRKPRRQSAGELKQIVTLRLGKDARLIRDDDDEDISWTQPIQHHPLNERINHTRTRDASCRSQ